MGSMGEVVARFGADITGFSLGIRTMTGLSTVFGGSMSGIFAGLSGGFNTIGSGIGNLVFGFRNFGTAGTIGMDAITQGLRGVGAGMLQTGGALLQMGARMALVVVQALALAAVIGGAVAVTIGIIAVKAAGDFQQGLNRLVTGAGDVTDNMQKMGQGILGVSTATGVLTSGTQGLNAAMYQIISSGERGAFALNTLSVAAKGAVAEQANVVDVVKALTTAMTDYGTKQYNATQFMNGYTRATQLGKISLEQLSTSMGPILPLAKNLGISFADVAGAMATMTNAGIPAERAATSLRFAFQSLENPTLKARTAMKDMGLSSIAVANELKVSLPGALEMIYNAAKKAGPEGSVPFNRAVSDMIGGQRSLQAFLSLTGTHFKTFSSDARAVAAAMDASKTAVLGWDTAQKNFNVQMDRVKAAVAAAAISIGTQLLPVLTQIVGRVAPVVIAFADWVTKTQVIQTSIGHLGAILNQIGGAFNSVFHPIQQVTGAIKPLTDSFDRATSTIKTVTTVAKPLTDSFDRATGAFKSTTPAAHGAVTAINPFIAIFQGIANVITFFVAVYHTVSAVITASIPVFQRIWAVLVQVGAFLSSTFAPVWAQLVTSFHDVMAALQPIMPQLQQLGAIIGGVVVVALVLVVAALMGLATGLAQVLIGVAQFVTGVVQFFSGLVQTISGIVQVIVDLVTGHFDRLGADLDRIMTGIVTMFVGIWNMIRGLWIASIGAVIALATGFVQGLISIFTGLYHSLVGGSIIPEMLTAIVAAFATLAGRVTGPINAAVQAILSILNGAISLATNAGTAIVNGIAAGLRAAAGAITSAMGFIGGIIHNMMPHSPAKEGPLRALDTYGPALAHGFAAGILKGAPEVRAAMNLMVTPPPGGFPSRTVGSTHGTGGASGPITLIVQFDTREVARQLAPALTNEIIFKVGGIA